MVVRHKLKVDGQTYLNKLERKRQTPEGAEILDSTPIAPPIGYRKQPSMVDHIRNMVRSEHLRIAAEQAQAETFEEADDFDIDDDPFPASKYEFEDVFDPPLPAEPASETPAPADPAAAAPAPDALDPASPPSPSSSGTT